MSQWFSKKVLVFSFWHCNFPAKNQFFMGNHVKPIRFCDVARGVIFYENRQGQIYGEHMANIWHRYGIHTPYIWHRYPHTAGFPFWKETQIENIPPPPDLPKIFLIFDTQNLWGRRLWLCGHSLGLCKTKTKTVCWYSWPGRPNSCARSKMLTIHFVNCRTSKINVVTADASRRFVSRMISGHYHQFTRVWSQNIF